MAIQGLYIDILVLHSNGALLESQAAQFWKSLATLSNLRRLRIQTVFMRGDSNFASNQFLEHLSLVTQLK